MDGCQPRVALVSRPPHPQGRAWREGHPWVWEDGHVSSRVNGHWGGSRQFPSPELRLPGKETLATGGWGTGLGEAAQWAHLEGAWLWEKGER